MMIGTVIEVTAADDVRAVRVDTGSGEVVTAYVTYSPGATWSPMVDDVVVLAPSSPYYSVVGVLRPTGPDNDGDVVLFSRDNNGAEKAKVVLKNDGTVTINDVFEVHP